eukprot:TRINITY_DN11630_c0_g1_i1.p1 TRINITY_DN11630_c0_g1~~TRINITY_DN11630_c0_g1_i1.p1  ORF type:complete len:207 (+),score=44.44 TRINITY_DN11630_c0_g1_i1:143-763(+)
MAQQDAQLVAEGVYLGPLVVAREEGKLAALGVTRVLSVLGEDQDFEHVAVADAARLWVKVTDRVEAEADMAAALPRAVAQVEAWRAEGHTVLIHCQSGISRSATVAIAYAAKSTGADLMAAYDAVAAARPCVNPNDGFFRVLQEYAATACGQTRDARADTREYNARQLVAQLAFVGVSVEQARAAVARADGDVARAASALLNELDA